MLHILLFMTEHQFQDNNFFDNLTQNNPHHHFFDVQELIMTSQEVEKENKTFHKKKKFTFNVLSAIMFLVGLSSFFLNSNASLTFIIFSLLLSVPFLLEALGYQPDKKIKNSLQKFQKSLSQGLRKPTSKRLAKSKTDRWIFGVFGGLSKYYGIPSFVLRMFAVASLFFSAGLVFFLYMLLATFLPEEDNLPELED